MKNGYLYFGITLFVLYIAQDFLGIRWQLLYDLQQGESFKRWSGLGLLIYIALQWSLTLFRTRKKWEHNAPVVMEIHKWMGAFSPLPFYLHSIEFGYAYLMALSIAFFANIFIGFANLEVFKTKAYWYFQAWMIVHVAISLTLTALSLYHIYIVFYYN